MFKNIFAKILKHKIYTGILAVIIIGGAWWGYKSFFPTVVPPQYITAPAEKGVLTVSVSGSGQVANSNKIDIKAQASGKLLSLSAVTGTQVKENQILMQLDATDAYKAVRDAQVNYQSAVLAMNKLTQPVDAFSLLQAQNALESAKNTLEKLRLSQASDYLKAQDDKQKAQDNITKAYEDSYNSISDAFLQLPSIMGGLDTILNSDEIAVAQPSLGFSGANPYALYNVLGPTDRLAFQQLIDRATVDYNTAQLKYNQNFTDYKNSNRYASQAQIEALLAETLDATKNIAQAVKSQSNMLDDWVGVGTRNGQPVMSVVSTYQTQLASYIGQVNSHLSALLAQQRTLQDNKDALTAAIRLLQQMDSNNPLDLTSAEQSVKQQEVSLQKLQAGTDPLDIKSQQISVQQRLNSLNDARSTLANYTVLSPFDGILAQVNVAPKDMVSSGTVVATVITNQQLADISLNEVDVAKIKAGQKANVTFDALTGLSISGRVASIDGVGTVTQGVVSYAVHIIFDTQDARIMPGMSVSVHIITEMKPDVVLVPNAAVKIRSGASYVQVMSNGVVHEQAVEVGLSNDSSTEIIQGINEGDLVVIQTITASKTSATQQSGNLLQSLTGGGNRQFGGSTGGGARPATGGAAAGR